MANQASRIGVLLMNLGTPDAPTPAKVKAYLKEFLMDPYVVDIPYPLRWFLVNVLIVPRRAAVSASQYEKVWMKEGSPLLHFSRELTIRTAKSLGPPYVVRLAMRYGNPSLEAALREMKSEKVSRIIAFPLYPQFSLAATKSSFDYLEREAKRLELGALLKCLPAFYDDEGYLQAVADVSAPMLAAQPYDMALFSFHGLPERQVRKTDLSGQHCLSRPDCCDRIESANRDCYRAQCYYTAKAVAKKLGLAPERYRVCFQSRLGRTPWIQPFTDELYRTLPAQGVKRLAVLCPSFVADCLETLEEVCFRGREEFQRHGGEDLFLVPSLNGNDAWVRAVKGMIERAI